MTMPEEPIAQDRTREAAVKGAAERVSWKARGFSASAYQGSDPAAGIPSQLGTLIGEYAQLAYWLPWEVLDYVELLSTYNPDFSQAIDNIRTLANSGHQLFVENLQGKAWEELKFMLEEKARTIQARHGGVDGLIDKLLDQAATYGAMCGEWAINEELTDVVDFIEVNPKSIRFFWVAEENDWGAYQKVTLEQAKEAAENGQEVRANSYVRLNPFTFMYYAFDAAPGSPYGVPPFIAALGNIAIQRDMVQNMAQIVKKTGLLGIIDIIVKALPTLPGESDADYTHRAGAYLDRYAQVVEDMVHDGGIIHFDDVEAKAYNITGNASGATAIFKQNEELIFSGLKSMPSVQGRSYSTTETYAGVAYDIIIRNTQKYQRACKRMIETGYWMMAMLWGAAPAVSSITLVFHPNKSLSRLQDAQAELMEIKNALMLWASGIIDQLTMANRLGYDSPAYEYVDPPESQLLGNGSPGGGGDMTLDTGEGVEGEEPTENKNVDFAGLRDRIIELGRIAGSEESREERKAAAEDVVAEAARMQGSLERAGMDPIRKWQAAILEALD